jgi:SurA-like N-terminal domain
MLTVNFFNDMEGLDVRPAVNGLFGDMWIRIRKFIARGIIGNFIGIEQAGCSSRQAPSGRFMPWIPAIRTGGLLALSLLVLAGCTKAKKDDDFLIRVGSSMITVAEFKQAVDSAAEEIFPGDQDVDAAVQKDLRMRVLNQLTEELIISERGKDLGLTVSDEEVQDAVAQIKADYPDDTFEKTLLENAISFQSWKKKLATRLLINKVIEHELVKKVEITSQDVAAYFQKQYPQGVPEGENTDEIDQKIVRHLRHQKAEEMYPAWIEKLRKTYPVDIQQERWKRLADSKS